MVNRLFSWLNDPLGRIGVLIVFLAVFSGAAFGVSQTQAAPAQPIEFPHDLHVGLSIQCLYCHPGAYRQASAGLPTQTKCWGCHQQLSKYADPSVVWPADLQKLKQYVESGEQIQWVPVAQVPDFVHFNHRPHIAAGLNCENCHGDMSKLKVAENPQVMNMGWCLECHRTRTEDNSQNNPGGDPAVSETLSEKRIKLLDCGTCHY
ncbi:MAG: cytochrome c3 family protein [Chloroflexota bacterium]